MRPDPGGRRAAIRRVAWMPLITVLMAACASAGTVAPGTVRAMELVGEWRFDVVLDESIQGTVTFLEDDRIVVRCLGDRGPPNLAAPLRSRNDAIDWSACGATFRTRRNADGDVVTTASRRVRRVVREERVCGLWQQEPTGPRTCIRWDRRPIYEERTLRADFILERVFPDGG